MTPHLDKLLKGYDRNIIVDKICDGEYDTYSPHSTTLHRHNYFQIVWIAKGEGIHFVEQHKYQYHNGSLFLLAPHFMHQIEYNKEVQGYVVSFSDTCLDSHQFQLALQFYNSQQCFLTVPDSEQELLNTEFQHLHHYFSNSHYVDQSSLLQNYLHIILTKIKGFSELHQKRVVSASHQELLGQFVMLVRDNYRQEKNLQFYLEKLAVSQRKLSDVVSLGTGISPAKFIEQYALNEAARLISFSTYSIKEIAAYVGYMDNSYFSRGFKKHFGKTPIQFKEEVVKR
ncbi:AraC family transcriptional regulator [Puteibacter caeruleilacunae]|nr:AraC family transcriptional regulator [Puteibacter caeruleilacunae]